MIHARSSQKYFSAPPPSPAGPDGETRRKTALAAGGVYTYPVKSYNLAGYIDYPHYTVAMAAPMLQVALTLLSPS